MIIVYCPRLSRVSAPLSEDILSARINVAHTSSYKSRSLDQMRGQLENILSMFFPSFLRL